MLNKKFRIRLFCILLAMTAVFSGTAGAAVPRDINFVNETVFEGDTGEKISFSFTDADIRDILSMFAMKLGVNVVYIGPVLNTSFHIEDIDATGAFEIFLKSTSVDGAGLSFIRKDDLIIVGSSPLLTNNFPEMLVISRFKLNYMTADDLKTHLGTLGIKVKSLTFGSNTNQIVVQGFPYQVAKVNEVINMLDVEDLYKVSQGEVKPTIELVSYKLKYITADIAKSVISQTGVPARVITISGSPGILWVTGTSSDIVNIKGILAKIDTPDNIKANDFAIYRLKYVKIDTINAAMNDLGLWQVAQGTDGNEKVIPSTVLSESPYAILVNFKYIDRDIFEYLIENIDIPTNMPENPTCFLYNFENITAKTAMSRIAAFESKMQYNVKEVVYKELSYSHISHQLLVFCTKGEETAVKAFLKDMDIKTDVHKIVVDRAGDYARLQARIVLISYLSGVPEKNFFVSNNVAAGNEHVTILEDTLENIDKVLSVIYMIDNPNPRSVDLEEP